MATVGATPADRRLLADGEMGETAIESFLAAASGGVQGMIEDYVTCCRRGASTCARCWARSTCGTASATATCPSSTPVRWPRRCRAAARSFDAEDGHFFFRRRVAEVLGALVAAAQPPKACAAAATISS